MGGFALADLAIAVFKAGGLGFIGSDGNLTNLAAELTKVEEALDRHNDLLPIGVGILLFAMKMPAVLEVIQRFRPRIVWLFAARSIHDYTTWAEEVRRVSPNSQVWVQIGSVDGALHIAKDVKPDTMCIQGIDAGGHGYEQGAGIISLLPEVVDTLAIAGYSHIPLVAAGGIVEGRAAAAALTLGAQGVVMGTRFLAASETNVHPEYRRAILGAKDGGQCTVRSKLFDELRGPNAWPQPYDGRSFRIQSFKEHAKGVHIDEIRERHSEAIKEDSRGFAADLSGRAATWAGTGVGLVKIEQSAGDIVESVRHGILVALEAARSRL
ncbi:related to FMN-dependent 2-nitropropane dioxygenase [Ramularia collo-cygni]|uniref:Related to FMN-dependent 2-nitropropane dioxygenase n=1 Tax=Ramularia collo-cygni TaxID=112498 RepID=A0A2D3UXJ6_9PEZI|nr:related to FMN-dependent 2-nitropropane dioxygenase [Ramularia collo-cygni]CZT17890.1 related to FMN-dependent 2-nitropropane dioxygenase [Ramularia collo-cygni]